MKILPVVLLLILLLLQYRLWVGDGSLAELRQLEAQLEVQQQENETLLQRNTLLENEVLDLKNGLDAVEERARSELGMIREGETFYLIVD